MKKLLNQIKPEFICLFFTAVFFYSCGKEKPETEYIARVDNSYLTEEEMAADLGTSNPHSSKKDEYIRNWIETELLFKEAVDEDINQEEAYIRAVNKSQKELAKALLIEKAVADEAIEIKNLELEEFYNKTKNEFELFDDHFLFNIITFSDEDKAILFRSTLIESDWNKATNVFTGDASILYEKEKEFLNINQINPYSVLIVIQELLPDEVSIVLNTGDDKYSVIQLIKKYNIGEIPELELIKTNVVERLTIVKTKQVIRDYIKGLYSKYHIEVK